MNHEGRELDRNHLGRTDWQVLKAAIDIEIAALVGRQTGERSEYSAVELKLIEERFSDVISAAVGRVFDNG